jgi:Fe-S cluster biogenesis protein NfuA
MLLAGTAARPRFLARRPLQTARPWLLKIHSKRIHQQEERLLKEAVEKALGKIRPMLQRDGGDVELIAVDNGVVKVRLTGACKGCPMSQMTLKNGIERLLKQEVPGLTAVEAV